MTSIAYNKGIEKKTAVTDRHVRMHVTQVNWKGVFLL